MAIAFDATSTSSTIAGPVSNLSWSHTTSGSDRLLIVRLM